MSASTRTFSRHVSFVTCERHLFTHTKSADKDCVSGQRSRLGRPYSLQAVGGATTPGRLEQGSGPRQL